MIVTVYLPADKQFTDTTCFVYRYGTYFVIITLLLWNILPLVRFFKEDSLNKNINLLECGSVSLLLNFMNSIISERIL